MLNHKGFSLLEVLIGVSIVAILAAIAVPNFTSYKKGAETKAALLKLSNIARAYNNCTKLASDFKQCDGIKTGTTNTQDFFNELDIKCLKCTVASNIANENFCVNYTEGISACISIEKDSRFEKIIFSGLCYQIRSGATGDAIDPTKEKDFTGQWTTKFCSSDTDCENISKADSGYELNGKCSHSLTGACNSDGICE